MLRYLLLSLLVLSFAPLVSVAADAPVAPDSAAPPEGGWQPKVHYTILEAANSSAPAPLAKVPVTEFFWLGCPHCFALEPYWVKWCENKPEYVDCQSEHVVWSDVKFFHARFFYTLEALGREDLRQKAFATIQDRDPSKVRNKLAVSKDAQKSFEVQRDFAVANGIDAELFTKTYYSVAVHEKMESIEALGKRWKIDGVPAMVIGGRFFTDVGMAGGPTRLGTLISALAACAHDATQCKAVNLPQSVAVAAK